MRAISNQISLSDMEILKKWLAKSETNTRIFEEMRKAWQMAERPSREFNPDVKNEWKRFENGVIRRRNPAVHEKMNQSLFLSKNSERRLRFAAMAALFFVIATVWKIGAAHQSMHIEKTGYAETGSVTLPDGSVVRLNADSKIRYSKQFGDKERIVYLKGEAFFEVQPGEMPFIVRTGNAKTTVAGTQFNVKYRNEKTCVIVRSGVVDFSGIGTKKSVTLRRDQMSGISSNGKPSQPVRVDAEKKLGWMEGVLVFENESLGEAIDEIERQYNVRITLDTRLMKRKLTGRFEKQSIDSLLKQICLAFQADYRIASNRISITVK